MSVTVVYPSAGHHLKDAGATYGGRQENKETIVFRNLLVGELNKLGIKTITDKDSQTNQEYQNSIKPGNGSVVLDIHFNAGVSTATGTECFIASGASPQSREMAGEICKKASDIMGINNRGVKVENQSQHGRIGILHTKAGISVLWEICFISNPNDMAKYDTHRDELVKEIAKICKKFDDLI
ncbi:MAG: N-acetylmuramoyl-L-alanine amidase [Bergeyella cardium]|nr:MAG TPA: Cell wall hydrolase autolysin [Caudoviricetes sp.]